MTAEISLILTIGVLLFCTFTVEGMTGFGSAVLAVPVLMYLVEVEVAVMMPLTLSLLLASIIVATNFRYIRWRQLLRIIVLAGIGTPFGILLFSRLPGAHVKSVIALFMIFVGLSGVYRLKKGLREEQKETPAKRIFYNVVLFLGGVVHGSFGVGGPLLVIYSAQAIRKKEEFRATMSMTWVGLSSLVTIKNIYIGAFAVKSTVTLLLCSVPFMLLGLAMGNYLHHKISQERFKMVVYLLLTAMGIVILASQFFAALSLG